MLDLQSFKEKSFELKMFDGEILKIKRPSQKMVIEMMGYEDTFKKNKNPKSMLDGFSSMILDILNNNLNDKKFTKEYVDEQFDLSTGMALVQAYMNFVTELNSDPN